MPLIHSKTPKAFKKNIETEMAHGKPQNQAVAIAYSEKRDAEHRVHRAFGGESAHEEMCAHGGPVHCNMGCYAEGGAVHDSSHRRDNEMGVHKENVVSQPQGVSSAGAHLRVSNRAEGNSDRDDFKRQAVRKHKQVLGEMRAMPKPKLYAEGGLVSMAEGGAIEDGEPEMEDELHHAIGSELMDALERKDHKGIMSALNAAIMECMNGEYK